MVSIVIAIAEGIALPVLPVRLYPNITLPTVNVPTDYPGASALLLQDWRATIAAGVSIPVALLGAMVPLRMVASIKTTLGPYVVNRFNQQVTATVNGLPSGTCPKAMRSHGRATQYITSLMSLIFAYPLLVALYESLALPIAILLSQWGSPRRGGRTGHHRPADEPSCADRPGSSDRPRGQERHEVGMSIIDAARTAAEARLRAVRMTALTFIFGVLPLAQSHGAQNAVGITMISGMLGATLIGPLSICRFIMSSKALLNGCRGSG